MWSIKKQNKELDNTRENKPQDMINRTMSGIEGKEPWVMVGDLHTIVLGIVE